MIAGVEPLTRSVLMGAEKLRVISRCSIGMDNVDMDAAAEKNILVKNTLDAPGMAVAELTVGLMLNLLRHVSEADRLIRADRWKQLMGRLLQKQTVGLVGFGRIGKRVARLVSAFGATILAYDTYEMPPFPDLLYAHIFFLSELPRPQGGVIHSGNIKGRFLRVTGRWENNEELLVISAFYDRRLKRRSK
jgi:phosphoglycerate dehydrogenase-like enzyme